MKRCSALLPTAVLTWLAVSVRAGEPLPTVIVDIRTAGATQVAELKTEATSGVRWSAEFGNELLLGVDPLHLEGWLARRDVRAGPARLDFDEIVVRDHVCTVHDTEPAVAVVGGYELLRKPAALARMTRGPAVTGEPLPADGVVSRALDNDPAMRARVQFRRGFDPETAAIVGRVVPARWHMAMSTLSSFDRNSFSPSLSAARDWILARFAEAGLSTSIFPFTLNVQPPTCASAAVNIWNPIGVKTGTTLPDEWIVIGAHYDARNVDRCGTGNPQPGANDNASGCAGVIELARVFQDIPTRRTLVFTCFSGEEQNLVGSQRWVLSLVNNGDIAKVQHMLNLDMIGHAVSADLDTKLETNTTFQGWLPVYAAAGSTYAPELNLITTTATQAYSDHWPFLVEGIPAMFTWENGAGIYPQYHTLDDLPANMLRAQQLAGGILKMDTAVLVDLAQPVGSLSLFRNGFE